MSEAPGKLYNRGMADWNRKPSAEVAAPDVRSSGGRGNVNQRARGPRRFNISAVSLAVLWFLAGSGEAAERCGALNSLCAVTLSSQPAFEANSIREPTVEPRDDHVGSRRVPTKVPLTIAVLPFKNSSGRVASEHLGGTIARALENGLLRVEGYRLVERARLKEVLDEMDLKSVGIVAGRVSELTEANRLVVGEYDDQSGIVDVSARILMPSSDVIRAAHWRGHVSAVHDAMAAQLAAELTGQAPPARGLSKQQEDLYREACGLYERGEWTRACEACTQILEQHPADVDVLILRGNAELERRGRTRLARRDFEKVLKSDRGHLAARVGIARVLLTGDKGAAAKAVGWLEEVLEQEPGHLQALALAAVAHLRIGKEATAESLARRAVEFCPEYGEAWQILAHLYSAQERNAEALTAAQSTARLLPDCADSWMILGDAQRRQGLADAAARSYRRGLTCRPSPDLEELLEARLRQFDGP